VVSGPLHELQSRMGDHRILQVHLLSDPAAVENALREFPAVRRVQALNGNALQKLVEIEFSGDDAMAADLLETLVAQRLRVVSFSEVSSDLEKAFLHLTRGETA